MEVKYHDGQHFLVVKVIGTWTEFDAVKSIDQIRNAVKKTDKDKMLFDLRELSFPQSDVTRHNSGKKFAEALSNYKIAGFSQAEKINYVGETSATNRGANFKMFDSESEAIEWLME